MGDEKAKNPYPFNLVYTFYRSSLARGKELAKNAYDDAFISYMGPAFGFLSILPAILLYILTRTDFWMVIVLIGSVINLFNLIPITPFDGGHIVKVINFKLVIVGFVFALSAMFFTSSYTFIFFVFLGLIYCIVFYVERRNLSDKLRKLRELNEFTQINLSAESNKDSIMEILKQVRENFYKLFASPFDEAIKVGEKGDSEHLQKVVVAIFSKYILEKRKYFNYLESFSTITQREKWNITLVYIALILLLVTTSYYGYSAIGHELKDINF